MITVPTNPYEMSDADWELAEKLAVELSKTPHARAIRLKEAVNHGGGPTAISKRISMPIATLNNYLAGRDMKASAMVSIADACDVSIRWLASGEGGMTEGTASDTGGIIPKFGESISKSANFWAIIVLLRTCQEFHSQVGLVPTLAEVLEWVAPLYPKARELPDRKIELKSDDEDPA